MNPLKVRHLKLEFSGYHFVSHNAEKPIFSDDNSIKFRKRNQVETDPSKINEAFPYLDSKIQKSIFIRNAGNVDSITMANLMLEECKLKGLKFIEGVITEINESKQLFGINIGSSQYLEVDQIIISAGPFINELGSMLALHFPVWNTLQRKFIIPDPKGIIPSEMPFTIYADGQYLDWSEEEKSFFENDEDLKWMNQKFPGAIHIKPESGGRIKLGWAFSREIINPKWDIPKSLYFPQVVLKGASRFIPGLADYAENIPTPLIEYGGYYTRTKENWPLIGPTDMDNVFVIGAMAGFGTMASCVAGELCSSYITGQSLPRYAPYFHPNRYTNPIISKELESIKTDGQL